MKRLACWALILAIASAPLSAQTAQDASHAQKIKARAAWALDHHRIVTVDTTDHRQLQGLVSETQPDHFVLALQGHTTTLAYTEVERIAWHQHVSRPVVAAATGIAVGVVLYVVLHALLAKNG
jgi:NADPH-dependent curcumin reductase CurA